MLNELFAIDLTSPVQLIGYVATLVGIAAFAVKDDRNFKTCMAASLVLWAVQYAMFHSWTAAATSVVIASRQALSMLAPSMSARGKMIMSAAYVAIFTVVLISTWKGLISIWPYLAAVNATYAFVYLSGARMRKQVMLSTGFWLVNAVLVGSVGHMISTIVTLSVSTLTLYRMRQDHLRKSFSERDERLNNEINVLRTDMEALKSAFGAFAEAHAHVKAPHTAEIVPLTGHAAASQTTARASRRA